MKLRTLFPSTPIVGSSTDPWVTRVDHDSRAAEAGSLFCCIRGSISDGHDHAPAAVARGAVALMCERELDLPVPQAIVPDARATVGPVASAVYGDPSSALSVIGITGTNGKTTTAHVVSHILTVAGRSTEVVGTLTGARTTPEAPDLQRILAAARDRGADAVVMEVSSHALELHRVAGTHFAVAGFTNLSRDHLDFHGTMEAYFAAKSRLFLDRTVAATAAVMVDDPWGVRLADAAAMPVHRVRTPPAAVASMTMRGFTFEWRGTTVSVPLAGGFNVANVALAAEIAGLAGVSDDHICEALTTIEPIPGRFQVIDGTERDPAVVVDYAHTPAGLASILASTRELTPGRLFAVVGCGGDRDRGKRAEMGRVAADTADVVVVTADNPRSEDPAAIIDAMVRPLGPRPDLVVEIDRRRAIEWAVGRARPGDTVVIAGKGHETTQTIGSDVIPFDDRVEAARALAARRGGDRA